MPEFLPDQILQRITEARELYYHLILLIGPAGSGKTEALRAVSDSIGAPLINVNLELSSRMLDLTERERILQVAPLLSETVDNVAGDLVLLDNLEMLFDVRLKQDPLLLLQRLSRSKTVVAAWNGLIVDEHLIYAVPSHPEYRRYPLPDALWVAAGTKA
jgi:SAM-dependent methyltransferase